MVNEACEACKAAIEGRKGRLVIKASARAVSERDDRLLTDQMKVRLCFAQLYCMPQAQ